MGISSPQRTCSRRAAVAPCRRVLGVTCSECTRFRRPSLACRCRCLTEHASAGTSAAAARLAVRSSPGRLRDGAFRCSRRMLKADRSGPRFARACCRSRSAARTRPVVKVRPNSEYLTSSLVLARRMQQDESLNEIRWRSLLPAYSVTLCAAKLSRAIASNSASHLHSLRYARASRLRVGTCLGKVCSGAAQIVLGTLGVTHAPHRHQAA
jgi:hypothetical protein